MNERTAYHHVRLGFHPNFGKTIGADLVREVARLRAESPDHPASAVLVQWHGDQPVSTARLIQHPLDVEAPIALVAGRHSRCDLGSIPGASLRHALMIFWPGDALGVLDHVCEIASEVPVYEVSRDMPCDEDGGS